MQKSRLFNFFLTLSFLLQGLAGFEVIASDFSGYLIADSATETQVVHDETTSLHWCHDEFNQFSGHHSEFCEAEKELSETERETKSDSDLKIAIFQSLPICWSASLYGSAGGFSVRQCEFFPVMSLVSYHVVIRC